MNERRLSSRCKLLIQVYCTFPLHFTTDKCLYTFPSANALKRWKVGASQEWLQKLPQLAKKLEESLYWSAYFPSQYKDTSTLLLRLKDLIVSIKASPESPASE